MIIIIIRYGRQEFGLSAEPSVASAQNYIASAHNFIQPQCRPLYSLRTLASVQNSIASELSIASAQNSI